MTGPSRAASPMRLPANPWLLGPAMLLSGCLWGCLWGCQSGSASSTAADQAEDAASSASDAADAPARPAAGDAAISDTTDPGQDTQPDAAQASQGDAPDGSDLAQDAGGQVCFKGAPPGPDAKVAVMAKPDTSACKWPPPKFLGKTQEGAKPTLLLEVGTHDPLTGHFVPYVDGQWLPLVHGSQGGFHVYAAIQVAIPDETAPVIKLQSEARGFEGCEMVAAGQQPVVYASPDPTAPGRYTTASKTNPGTRVIFGVTSDEVGLYCGHWFSLVVRARQVGSAAWGERRVTFRSYDTVPWQP